MTSAFCFFGSRVLVVPHANITTWTKRMKILTETCSSQWGRRWSECSHTEPSQCFVMTPMSQFCSGCYQANRPDLNLSVPQTKANIKPEQNPKDIQAHFSPLWSVSILMGKHLLTFLCQLSPGTCGAFCATGTCFNLVPGWFFSLQKSPCSPLKGSGTLWWGLQCWTSLIGQIHSAVSILREIQLITRTL